MTKNILVTRNSINFIVRQSNYCRIKYNVLQQRIENENKLFITHVPCYFVTQNSIP